MRAIAVVLLVSALGASDDAVRLRPGRQLFVDDALLSERTLTRVFHAATPRAENPVLKPETALETGGCWWPCATPFDDGAWWDERDQRFKLWYCAGWTGGVALATSVDGIHWDRPALDVEPGTNLVLPRRPDAWRDGVTVWLDHAAVDPAERWKMLAYFRYGDVVEGKYYPQHQRSESADVLTSPDGIHWTRRGPVGRCGDNTTFFWNPFRRTWMFSVRTYGRVRTRSLRETPDFIAGAAWRETDLVPWLACDGFDRPDPAIGDEPQLYTVSAVAYESTLVGLFSIHRGPANEVCERGKFPKITDLEVGFSADGLAWDRASRAPLLACSRRAGAWDRGYLHGTNGCFLVVGDELWFPYGGWSGESPRLGGHLYAGGATGIATLRRDGFASLDAGEDEGVATTRPFICASAHAFVNVAAAGGELRVEALDAAGAPIPGYASRPIAVDAATRAIAWAGAADLAPLVGTPIRLRFRLRRGSLYAFWLTDDAQGASHGYVAAGGPGFAGATDEVGLRRAPLRRE